MTDLEKDLRELLNKYNMEIHEISIILTNYERNILEIVFEDIDEELNGIYKKQNFMCKRFKRSY